jgi:5'-3' exoribonuclease 1
MYGGDADLIMLGLATHEPHFCLLREVVNFNQNRFGSAKQTVMRQTKEVSFQLMHISVVREYIELDLALGCGRAVDKERMCDDFIFLTFLVGNDFLPHLPTLDIGEHAFDVVFGAYKQLLADGEDYLVTDGELKDMKCVEKLFKIIGEQEADILANREVEDKKFKSKKRGMSKAELAAAGKFRGVREKRVKRRELKL